MEKMKKSWLMMIALAVIITGIAGLVAPKEAEASWLYTNRSGYFSNYVETQDYQGKYSSSTKSVALLSGSIVANSSATGSFSLHIQTKASGGTWKTIKTIKVNKNGTTRFESPKFSTKSGYRFKLVNEGTKSRVNYKMSWIPFGYGN
ncbi:hypothetical protein [Sporosarcina sp. G11-34]|uniref:hypothetical protein n=1 Tax=Sporosarcina sp. G11-34 TaxID=2849605 RepID=UPI0022A8FB0D|nr:hypothetical protein [Sporosarcina sp. G11-34]MCZ2257332.1 hypothetical protein [Sporosarcina sp. G11-34]